ncbi:hypothetical protein PC118_g10773 [Phytophthora cactorum]|uniref:Homeodomain-like n=1 Tax=Phytophthora cactorum TaxID=29920 RepID=A0A8T1G1W7_9STRA|nr:hypothetical protein PC118_g10773 [Phytophthora cactorum]
MPSRYNRYALETKLRVLEVAGRNGVWEETAEDLGVNYNTARAWVRRHVTHGEEGDHEKSPPGVSPHCCQLLSTRGDYGR